MVRALIPLCSEVTGVTLAAVELDRQELVRVLRTEGDNDTADRVEAQLPDRIDTERDADALADVGLDRTQLMAKLAGGALGGTIAP